MIISFILLNIWGPCLLIDIVQIIDLEIVNAI